MEIEEVREIDGERYLAPKAAAAEFGFTKDQIGQMARLGSVEAKLIGRVWYIRARDLIERRAREQAEREAREAAERAKKESTRKHMVPDDVMTFTRRLAQSKTDRSVPREKKAHGVALADREVDSVRGEAAISAAADSSAHERDVVREEDVPTSPLPVSTRAIGAKPSERLREEHDRGNRHARLLGSMDVRYEQRTPLSYEYEPVLPPLHKEGVSMERRAGLPKREESATVRPTPPREHSRNRTGHTERPAFDAVKKTSQQRGAVRVTETSRPPRAPDAALQRPRKKKKGKRIHKKKRVRQVILTWCIIAVLVTIALYAAVVFFEGA